MNKQKHLIFTRILCDESLNLKDLGLLATMLILKDDWHYSVEGLSKILPDSNTKIRASINRLQEKGYIEYHQKRTATNRFSCMEVKFKCPNNSSNRVFISKEQYEYIFTTLNNLSLRMEDRGMLLRLIFLDTESLSYENLARILPDGITVIKSTIQRLRENHYLIKKQNPETRQVNYKIIGIMQEVKPNTSKTKNKKITKLYNINFRISRKNQKLIQENSNSKTFEEFITTIQGIIGTTTIEENRIIEAAYIRDTSLSDIIQLIQEVRKSDFLQNRTEVEWVCTPYWIAKNAKIIISGKYRTYTTYIHNNIKKPAFEQHEYDFDELERQLSAANLKALNAYRKKAQKHTQEIKPTEKIKNNKTTLKINNFEKDKINISTPNNTLINQLNSNNISRDTINGLDGNTMPYSIYNTESKIEQSFLAL